MAVDVVSCEGEAECICTNAKLRQGEERGHVLPDVGTSQENVVGEALALPSIYLVGKELGRGSCFVCLVA